MATFFKKKPESPRAEEGERVYAIGDIHGRHDLFRILLSKIVHHWESTPKRAKRVELLLLGDIIDRGPASAECLELAHDLVTTSGVRLLKGNHEDLLLKSVAGHAIAQDIWLEHGGRAFLESFRIAPPAPEEDCFDFGDRIAASIPARFVGMLEKAPLSYRSGDYFFVHAGVRPGVALDKQDEQDLLFIRDEFTTSKRRHDAVVVHGHSIVESAQFHRNRIAIDTGAYESGRLSCLCIEGDRREILHT